jgi:carbohydrate-selective porin OprB
VRAKAKWLSYSTGANAKVLTERFSQRNIIRTQKIIDPFGNPIGGQKQGFTDKNLLGVDLIVDAEKLVGLQGGQFRIGFADNFGASLSQNYVGNAFPIQLADVAPVGPRLTYLYYTQSLFDEKLSIRFGRLTITAFMAKNSQLRSISRRSVRSPSISRRSESSMRRGHLAIL